MRSTLIQLTIALSCLTLSVLGQEKNYVPVKDTVVAEKIKKWQDLKFGLFMHWGPYSQWGTEASWTICPGDWPFRFNDRNLEDYFAYLKDYENLPKTFNPLQFDPERWAKAAKEAGMRYVVFTTKHHDGFCMYDTAETDYKITGTSCPFSVNPKADVTREIFNSFRKEGFWIGAYFSKADWHSNDYWWRRFPPYDQNVNYNPADYPERWDRFVQFTHRQILEILSKYGPVDILWLDPQDVQKRSREELEAYYKKCVTSDNGFVKARQVNQDLGMDELVAKARAIQPSLIVVDRFVGGAHENYITPENTVPEKALDFPWESCITSCNSWSYMFNAEYVSGFEVIHKLVDIVAKGGNLLLNIPPSPTGTWDDPIYVMLREVGDWMKVNNEAIYSTRSLSPYVDGKLRFTQKADGKRFVIYLPDKDEHVIPREIRIADFPLASGARISVLGGPETVSWSREGNAVTIAIPESLSANPPCLHAWVFKVD